ncbi:MAG: hypothetical protein GTN76_11285 [Candidatus Aenigmarchaeota archaeon]|nr:hypothetical protein [Candidatus Aenigmarchaeota archaeon]NIQ18011.1 hypothetical protein [Candidatus Aenigmarchaeota archaeon]
MINYRKLAREVFKVLCETEYESEVFLKRNRVYEDIKGRFKIGEDKLGEFLKTYEIEKNGEVCYRNPFKYDQFILSMIEHLITGGGISQPIGIDDRPEVQVKEGETADNLSLEFQRRYNIKITPGKIRSLVRKSHSKVKEGHDDHIYVSSR